MWQYKGIGKMSGSWQDMPRGVAEDVERQYFEQFGEHGGRAWRPWEYTFTATDSGVQVAMTFHFDSMRQYSVTHDVWRRIRRIQITDE